MIRNKDITGKDLEKALGDVNITVNKNAVPNDPQSPFVTSGIRLGTPAVTTRGFGGDEVEILTNWICDVVLDHSNVDKINTIKNKVIEMCKRKFKPSDCFKFQVEVKEICVGNKTNIFQYRQPFWRNFVLPKDEIIALESK